MTSSVGLVVVGYESNEEWNGFFDRVRESTLQPREIVVVDNSPLSPFDPSGIRDLPIHVVHLPSNPGYGSAANTGVAALSGDTDWVVVCNPDTRIEPDTLGQLLAASNTFPRIGVLGPRILNSHRIVYPSARAIPGIRIGVGHAFFARIWPANPWTRAYLGSYEDTEPRSVGWLSGAFLMIKRDIFESIKGFDEGFFMFFEDVDLGMRIKLAGYRNIYVPLSQVTHSGAASTAGHEKEMVLAHHRSGELFLAKLYPRPLQWPLRVALRMGLRIRAYFQTRKLN